MKLRLSKALFVTLVFPALLCVGAFSQQGFEDPVTFHVRPEITYQTMSGFGAGVYQNTLKDIQALDKKHHSRVYDLLYGDAGVRLNIIRFHLSGYAKPLNANDPLRAQGLRYDWEHDTHTQNVYRAMEPALKRGKFIVYAVPFTPPPRWKSNNEPIWGGRVPPEHYREYADYLADAVDYYKKIHGLTVDVLSLQNEPDISIFWESCRWTGEELRDFLKVLAPAFRERGLSTKFMLSEGSSWDQAWMRVEPSLSDPQTRDAVGILASHSYGDDDLVDRGRDFFRAASAKLKVPVWTSEMSLIGLPDDPGMNAALKIAHLMYLDITRGGAAAWIYCFTIFTPEFPGSMGVLSPATKQGGLVVPKRFWAMANYSHFIRPGWKRIQIDGFGFANSAFISPEGDRFALVALNASLVQRPALYYFGDHRISSVEAHLTSADSDLSPLFVTKVEQNHFEINLPPRSVTTITGKLLAKGSGK